MIPIALGQTIVIIPRAEPTNIDVYVYNEYTKTEVASLDVSFQYTGGYLIFDYDNLTDAGMQYTIRVVESNTSEVLFKGKCLGVSQTGTILMLDDTTGIMLNTTQGLLI